MFDSSMLGTFIFYLFMAFCLYCVFLIVGIGLIGLWHWVPLKIIGSTLRASQKKELDPDFPLRGIDVNFSRCSCKTMYRVIGVDTFDHQDWVKGDFSSFSAAKKCCDDAVFGTSMLRYYIYDDQGRNVYDVGTF